MLTSTIENLATLLGVSSDTLMNVITFFIVILLIIISLSSGLEFKGIALIYGVTMTILQLLGIESVFNIFTLIISAIEGLANEIFMGVVYGY